MRHQVYKERTQLLDGMNFLVIFKQIWPLPVENMASTPGFTSTSGDAIIQLPLIAFRTNADLLKKYTFVLNQ